MDDEQKPKKSEDGFLNACVIGSCPQIKRKGGRILIRNSQKPEVIVEFSEQEYQELKQAIAKNIF
ncbi:hypothetical protein KJ969_00175 [Patescibacteria group bacterium]|nr:hypothetical protein [Patescibacteria group bacterium]MBU1922270.1 hypothetical protein [Patescibacteria group bacterium]